MVDYNLINTLDDVDGIDAEVGKLFGDSGFDESMLDSMVSEEKQDDLAAGTLLKGKIIGLSR
jgi:hypothetical protein